MHLIDAESDLSFSFVVQAVAGSNPVVHPSLEPCSSVVSLPEASMARLKKGDNGTSENFGPSFPRAIKGLDISASRYELLPL